MRSPTSLLIRMFVSTVACAQVIAAATVAFSADCDVAGADAESLAEAREEIDARCPCGVSSRKLYRKCARSAVDDRIGDGLLRSQCRNEALEYARESICGRPGAAVCCRLNLRGKERHRIVPDASRCKPPLGGTACVSEHTTTVLGCDASGCLPLPECGNDIVEPGEECDPPDFLTCDFSCQLFDCEQPLGACGNGTVDPGEACEPPGTATCDRQCQAAACGAPPSGEQTITCTDEVPGCAADSNGVNHLVAWSARLHQPGRDILARRVDLAGAPLDPGPTVMSENLLCEGSDGGPAVASDGSDYGISWLTNGSVPDVPGAIVQAVYARESDGDGGGPTGPAVELVQHVPIGVCRTSLAGPTAIAAGPSALYTGLYREIASCMGDIIGESGAGARVPLPDGSPILGFSFDLLSGPPAFFASGPAAIDALGADTLAAWSSTFVDEVFMTTPVLRGAWVEPSGPLSPFVIRLARWANSPAVSAGEASFLVAFAARADDASTTATEIRGIRVTRAAGALDPDFGLLLATSPTEITQRPAIAFDGENWLVAWVEESGGGHDLKAVAVRPDGTVIDATPRLLAAGVANAPPALSSPGDGSVLAVFARSAGAGAWALNTLVVDGS